MDEIHENQSGEVLPYQFEPEATGNTSGYSDSQSDSESTSSSEDEVDEIHRIFERENAWRLNSMTWCQCGNCSPMNKAVESFCCHEKAVEYDEYDALLSEAEGRQEKCVTTLPEFNENMLSEGVLKVDVCRYLEENWPLGDEDIERTHKLYRLVAYQRCSRWIFQILGKKKRRPFPACIYKKIRDRFASPDGLYTHFKYTKTTR
jgi:hypothetical protein